MFEEAFDQRDLLSHLYERIKGYQKFMRILSDNKHSFAKVYFHSWMDCMASSLCGVTILRQSITLQA